MYSSTMRDLGGKTGYVLCFKNELMYVSGEVRQNLAASPANQVGKKEE